MPSQASFCTRLYALTLLLGGVLGGVTKNNQGWTQLRRESPIAPVQQDSSPSVYSTLPDTNSNYQMVGQDPVTSFAYQQQQQQQQQPQFQQPQQPQQFFQQQQPQQQQQPFDPVSFQDFQNQQNNFLQQQPFDASANEVQVQEESPGFFSGLMTSILDNTGLGAVWNRMTEMWTNLTGGSETMSRIMMGAMALPVLLPMAAVPMGLGAMALMSLPILQLTLPGIRRSFSDGATQAHSILSSEECMERLSCNLAKKFTTSYDAIFSRLENSENRWLHRVSKSVKAGRTGKDCQQFTCSPVSRMQRMVKTYILGDKPEQDGDGDEVVEERNEKI